MHGLANTTYGIYAWEELPDDAYYDPDFLADYASTAQAINVSSGKHYQVKLHAPPPPSNRSSCHAVWVDFTNPFVWIAARSTISNSQRRICRQ